MVEAYEATLACDPQLEINKQALNQRENALFLSHPEWLKNDFYLHSLNNLYYATMALEGGGVMRICRVGGLIRYSFIVFFSYLTDATLIKFISKLVLLLCHTQ